MRSPEATSATAVRERLIALPHGEIAVRERDGDGMPLMLLHALSSSAAAWTRVIAALPDGMPVIAPDLRGRGETRLDGPGGIDAHVADLIALLDALDVRSVVVAGHSFGAIVAVALARSAPARVAALVLVDGATRPPDAALEAADGAAARCRATWASAEDYLAAMRSSYAWRDAWSSELASELRGDVRRTAEGWRVRGDAAVVAGDVAAMRALDPTAPGPRCPVTVVRAGGGVLRPDDRVLGDPEVASLRASWGAQVTTLDDARHSSILHTHAGAVGSACDAAVRSGPVETEREGNTDASA